MDAVEKYRMRRDARLKKRLDDEWITINGTHVMVDDNKNIMKGPAALKNAPKKREKTKLERDADRFHNALKEWEGVDFPEDKSEAVSVEDYQKKKMKDDLDRFSRLMHEPDESGKKAKAFSAKESENEVRDLIEKSEHYGPDFHEKMNAWADSLPEGTTVEWKGGKVTKRPDGKFEGEDRRGAFTMDTKRMTEWLSNNVTHDLMTDDWDTVGVKVKEKSAAMKAGEKIKHRELGEGTITKIGENGNIYADFGGKKRIFKPNAIEEGHIAKAGEDYKAKKSKPIIPKSFGAEDVGTSERLSKAYQKSGGEEQRMVGRDRAKEPDKFDVPSNITSKSLKAMKRGDLETFATAIYANKAMESGLSKEEGVRRAKSLMSGNTTAQLIKYIEKNTKRK